MKSFRPSVLFEINKKLRLNLNLVGVPLEFINIIKDVDLSHFKEISGGQLIRYKE